MLKAKRKYRSINRNKRTNYNKVDYIISIIVLTMIIIGAVFIKLGLDYDSTPIYSYTAQKSNNYEVLLEPNTFYLEKSLSPGHYYASKSVDEYIINFQYDFKGNKNTNIEYNYNITADLVGSASTSDNQNQEVWNRTFILFENVSNQINENTFSINQGTDIDYEYYRNLVNSYEETYGITIDAVLKVRLNVSYNIHLSHLGTDNETVDDYIELDIPITNTVTEAKGNYQPITTNNISSNVRTINIFYYVIASIFIIGAIILAIIRIIKKIKANSKEIYKYNMNRILKYYKELIVTVTNKPDLTNLKIMNVALLDDLIDVAEQNKCNIICYEIVKNEESHLYVIVNDYVYIYVVTNVESK